MSIGLVKIASVHVIIIRAKVKKSCEKVRISRSSRGRFKHVKNLADVVGIVCTPFFISPRTHVVSVKFSNDRTFHLFHLGDDDVAQSCRAMFTS